MLNVAGVNGTNQAGAVPLLDYVVAAVPPTAVLLAFGVLMRQIHQLVDQPGDHADTPDPAASVSVQPLKSPVQDEAVVRRGGRPADATLDKLVEIGRIAVAEHGRVSRSVVLQAIRDKGLKVGGERLTEVMNTLRAESETSLIDG